ncbi:MAG: hypothetical protein QW532_03690 [Archaeoglobaceae archaeon]
MKFADVIEIKSKAKLSEHYRILAEVLNEIRKQDETSWIWNKAKLELSYLSRVVERNLAEFNVEEKGSALIIDQTMNDCFLCIGQIITTYYSLPLCATCVSRLGACWAIFTQLTCLGCIALQCSACIISLASHVYSCYNCAKYMGWI